MEKIRISKLMAERGMCSRREADAYIERGWVRVDGVVVSELGSKAYPNQKITLDKQAQRRQGSRVTILLNKPVGYVSAQAERGYRPAVSLITARTLHNPSRAPFPFDPALLRGLAPARRLDICAKGLPAHTQFGRNALPPIRQHLQH